MKLDRRHRRMSGSTSGKPRSSPSKEVRAEEVRVEMEVEVEKEG